MIILGVDPGVKGGWAVLRLLPDSRLRLEQYGPVPVLGKGRGAVVDTLALAKAWRGTVWPWPEVQVVVEAVSSRPGQGLASTWAFARSLGALEGVLGGLGVAALGRVQPGVWKASFGLPGGRKGKADSIALAQRLTGCDRLGEHEAEACLMAWYWGKKMAEDVGRGG